MHRETITAVFLSLLSCKTPSPAAAPRPLEALHPCDPGGATSLFVPDAGRCRDDGDLSTCPAHCGDGQRQWVLCERRITVPCGAPAIDETSCRELADVCDGTNLGEGSCASLGFRGGQLRCRYDCAGYDTSACDHCPATPGASCFQVEGAEMTVQAVAPMGVDGVLAAVIDASDDRQLIWFRDGRPARKIGWPHGDVVDLIDTRAGAVVLSTSAQGPELFNVAASGAVNPSKLPADLREGCSRLLEASTGTPVILSDPSCGGTQRAAMVDASNRAVPLPLGVPLALAGQRTEPSSGGVMRTESAVTVLELVSVNDECQLSVWSGAEGRSHALAREASVEVQLGEAGAFTSSGKGCGGVWRAGTRSVSLEVPPAPVVPEVLLDGWQRWGKRRWMAVAGQTIVLLPPR